MRCKTFNVPKDFRSQFRKMEDDKKEEVKLATNSMIITEENEISSVASKNTIKAIVKGLDKKEIIEPTPFDHITPGASIRLNR